jgi:hypothetical protein
MKKSEFTCLLQAQISSLEYSFKEYENYFILTINGRSIKFYKSSTDGQFKPNSWLRKKHEDEKIHEPGLVATWVLFSQLMDRDVDFFDIGSLFGYHSNIVPSFMENCTCTLIEGNPITLSVSKKILAGKEFEFINCVVGKDKSPSWYFVDVYNFFPAFSYQAIKIKAFLTVKNFIKTVLNFLGSQYTTNLYQHFFLIPTLSIPTLISPEINRQIIIKVDAEGHQFNFLLPHIGYLKENNCVVLIELDEPKKMRMLGGTNRELIERLGDAGFSIFWLDHRHPSEVISVEKFYPWMDKNSLAICLPEDILASLSC